MRDLAYAAIWLTLLPASLLAPYIGVVLWIWTALLSPNELFYGFMASVPLNKIVAVSTLFALLISKEKLRLYFDRTMGLLLLFAGGATMSWLLAISPSENGNDLYQKVMKEILLALLVIVTIDRHSRIHLAVLVIAVSIGFVGVKEGLMFLATAGNHKVLGNGSIGDNNSVATALLMTIPLMYYLYRWIGRYYIRIGMMIAMVLSVIAVMATFSRGGFIGLIVLGLFTLKNGRNRLASFAVVLMAIAIIYAVAPESWYARQGTIDTANMDGSFTGRIIAWKISLLIALDHPLFGGGMHAVQQVPTWISYAPRIGIFSFIPTPMPDSYPHAAHSIWFEIVGDLGFFGLTIFVGLLLTAYFNLRATIRAAKHDPALRWAGDLAGMLQISLVIYVVTASALSMGYFEMLYILLGLISRLRWLAAAERNVSAGGVSDTNAWRGKRVRLAA